MMAGWKQMSGLKNVRHRHDDALSRVDWASVESLLAMYYRGQGWQVEHCGTGAGGRCFDGGIDLKLRRGDEYVLVQSKHWNAKQVPHNDVHQLLGVMVNEGATGAILVSSGEFTRAAIDAARKLGHVQLVDGSALRDMLGPLPEPPAQAGNQPESLQFKAKPQAVSKPKRSSVSGWVWVCLVGMVAFVFIIRALIERTAGTAGPAETTVRADASVPADNTARGAALGDRPIEAPALSEQRCHEVIDAPSGTYIDHCSSGMPPPKQSRAEIIESQRRAAEAMKIIEDTTPEM